MSAGVELVRLYVLLYAASAIGLASRINSTTDVSLALDPTVPSHYRAARCSCDNVVGNTIDEG